MTIDQGIEHQRAGRLNEAEMIYRRILSAEPFHPDALYFLGLIAAQVGKLDVAADLIRRAIAVNPNAPLCHADLGRVLVLANLPHEAIPALRRALALQPDNPIALNDLGSALHATGQSADAVTAYERALELNPESPNLWYNLGVTLVGADQGDRALAAFERAISLRPDFPEAHNNLGNLLRQSDRFEEAMGEYQKAIAARPDFPEAVGNLATVQLELAQFDQAVEGFEKALSLEPDLAAAHYNLSLALLVRGQFLRAWPHYAWRWRVKEAGLSHQPFAQPLWDGTDPRGRRILVHAEQGFGDAIHFCRYAPLLAERGARVVLSCQRPLARLMRSLRGVETVVTHGDTVTDIDFHCPLLTLPLLFDTTLETIPADVPYIHSDPGLSSQWRDRLAEFPGTKVGLAWTGRASYSQNRKRSIPPEQLAALCRIEGATFFSLQKGHAPLASGDLKLIDFTSDLHDFADTAAMIDHLDLVISVDTSAAHLAGALGRRTWILLPHVPEWRWLLDRDDSPWYPTMRLYRQESRGHWQAPIMQIVEDLRNLAS